MFTEREIELLREAVTDMAIYSSSTYFESERDKVLEKLQMIPTIKQEETSEIFKKCKRCGESARSLFIKKSGLCGHCEIMTKLNRSSTGVINKLINQQQEE